MSVDAIISNPDNELIFDDKKYSWQALMNVLWGFAP
jgi:hypothetical protein